MQVSKFSTGGFVVHKASLVGSKRQFNLWFNSKGLLTDARGYDSMHRESPVTVDQWARLERSYKYLATCLHHAA